MNVQTKRYKFSYHNGITDESLGNVYDVLADPQAFVGIQKIRIGAAGLRIPVVDKSYDRTTNVDAHVLFECTDQQPRDSAKWVLCAPQPIAQT